MKPGNLLDLMNPAPRVNIPTSRVKPPIFSFEPPVCYIKPALIKVKYMDFSYEGDMRHLKRTLKLLKDKLNPMLKDTVKNINEVTNGILDEVPESDEEYDDMGYV